MPAFITGGNHDHALQGATHGRDGRQAVAFIIDPGDQAVAASANTAGGPVIHYPGAAVEDEPSRVTLELPGRPIKLTAEVGMDVTVGTFNLNNLFSRFNFRAEVSSVQPAENGEGLTGSYVFDDPEQVRLRTYKGKLVKGKDPEDQKSIAERILRMDLDVLAVQEVEDIDTLRFFAAQQLGHAYPNLTLIEGNDPRLIDLAVLSKLPIGAVTSWQHAAHPKLHTERVFSRDLLEVEILDPRDRDRRLLTIFNNHLKSQFVEPGHSPELGAAANDERRRLQAETIAHIVSARSRPDGRFLVLGDMNDTPDAPTLSALGHSSELSLTEGLSHPVETREPKADVPPPPPSGSWTHRFKESGQPAKYELFDQIWLSRNLVSRQKGAFIDRRTRHGGDGSDHDPAWVVLDL
ncbi:endonuclease/exonuclease/phosphatase family protein [Streptomyces sp. NPDC004647]|uniref:endonuclease/exonuclease/phosphatase family protein n=1 Tax=Streptomyces sp. NPDC004647 TaxID=3154671 RepID=UPI00339EDA9B